MDSESEMFSATLLINIVTVIQKGRADEASAESEKGGRERRETDKKKKKEETHNIHPSIHRLCLNSILTHLSVNIRENNYRFVC